MLFRSGNRDLVIDPLLAKVIGTGLASQPADADVRAELNVLINKLRAGAASSATVTKAACAAALGSGALTIQ